MYTRGYVVDEAWFFYSDISPPSPNFTGGIVQNSILLLLTLNRLRFETEQYIWNIKAIL